MKIPIQRRPIIDCVRLRGASLAANAEGLRNKANHTMSKSMPRFIFEVSPVAKKRVYDFQRNPHRLWKAAVMGSRLERAKNNTNCKKLVTNTCRISTLKHL